MSIRAWLALIGAGLLAVGLWYGWQILNGLGVYIDAGEQTQTLLGQAERAGYTAYAGLAAARIFWPVAVGAALLGGAVFVVVASLLQGWSLSADTRAELARAAQTAKAAEKRAQTAEQRAREALAAEWQRLRETQAAVELRHADAEQLVVNARQIASAATERAAIAERDMARLEKRSKNHKAAFTRLRAKVDRMEAEQGEGHG